MTEPQRTSRASSPDQRLIGWFVIAIALGAFVLTARDALRGNAVRWTTWMLPALVIVDMGLILGWLDRWPTLVRPIYALSIVAAAAVLISLVLTHLHS